MNCSAMVLTELCRLSQGQDYSLSRCGIETAQTGETMRGHGSAYTVLSVCPPELGAGGPFIPWH